MVPRNASIRNAYTTHVLERPRLNHLGLLHPGTPRIFAAESRGIRLRPSAPCTAPELPVQVKQGFRRPSLHSHSVRDFGRKLRMSNLLGTIQVKGSRYLGGSGCPILDDALDRRSGYSGSLADCVADCVSNPLVPKLNLTPALSVSLAGNFVSVYDKHLADIALESAQPLTRAFAASACSRVPRSIMTSRSPSKLQGRTPGSLQDQCHQCHGNMTHTAPHQVTPTLLSNCSPAGLTSRSSSRRSAIAFPHSQRCGWATSRT